ncbi:MAG: MarR family winged helix-turn-helix transcriptional regulator [Acutalibacteraceae bacterium]
MDTEYLLTQILETFDKIDTEAMLDKFRLSLKGENLLMVMLGELGGISTQSKLIERLDFTAARLCAIVKSLESKGLVQKLKSSSDKRSVTVALTEEGRCMVASLREELLRNALTIIEQLGEKDVCEFLRIFNKLADIANQALPEKKEVKV